MRAQFVTASERKMASSKRSCLYIILLLCYNVLPIASTTRYSVPSEATIDLLVQRIRNDLNELVNEVSGKEELMAQYSEQSFLLHPVLGENVLEEAIEKLEPVFQRRVRALEDIAKKTEELAMQHDYEMEPKLEQVPFINGKDWNDSVNKSLINQPQFGNIAVNVNSSAVHLPLQVYEGWMWHKFKPVWWDDSDTLNTIKWTSHLDDTFRENLKRDPTLQWQYFASRQGLLRYYPAHRWRVQQNETDTYDARQRHWFSQSLSSSKDLLIMLDMSGSVHGPTFEMMKITVKRLLGTLTQYDFFNVLKFNDTASWLIPCADALLPATTKNKQLIYQALDSIVAVGKGSFDTAFNFTYHYILKLQEMRQKESFGSNCHLAVVLISDGGTDFPYEQVVKIANNSVTRQTRLFTLAVGPHPIPTVNLRNISCSSNASHGAILTFGAIPSKVQGYLQVLGRPLALSQNQDLIDWSLSYPDVSGSGAVISITKPVFNKAVNLSQTLVGVAGVDVPVATFHSALPDSQLGFGGYKMVVMPTGNALLHPQLEQHASYIEDMLMVDFEDLESTGVWTQSLRQHLIDRNVGMQHYSPTVLVDDAYVVNQQRTWYFRPVGKTPYSLAVSINDGANIIVPNLEIRGPLVWKSNMMTTAAPWLFCRHIQANYSSPKESAAYFNELIKSFEHGNEHCDQSALSHLLWDLETTANVSEHWPSDPRFRSRFVATTGGVSRIETPSHPFVERDLRNPGNSSVFLRLAHSNASILLQPPMDDREDFLIASKITLEEQLLAVTGGFVSKEAVQSMWMRATSLLNGSDHLHLYWLDEAGYVIASNQINILPGTFIGASQVEPQIMKMLRMGSSPVYQKISTVKSTVRCPFFPKSPVSSASLFSSKWITRWPLNASAALLGTAQMLYAFFMSVFFTSSASATLIQSELQLSQLRPMPVDNHLCSKTYVIYQLQSFYQLPADDSCSSVCGGVDEMEKDGPSNRILHIQQIPDTKSILVVATAPCSCTASPVFPYGLTKVESEFEKCQHEHRYRRPAGVCYAHDARESRPTLECVGHSFHSATLLPSMICIFVAVWILR